VLSSGLSPDPPPVLESHAAQPPAATQAPPLETTPTFATPRIVGPDPILTEPVPTAAPVQPIAASADAVAPSPPAASVPVDHLSFAERPVVAHPSPVPDVVAATGPIQHAPFEHAPVQSAPIERAPFEHGATEHTAIQQAHIEPASIAAAPGPEIAVLPPQEPSRSWSISFARIGEELMAWFKTLLSAAVYATLIVTFGFQVARVEGQSMVPTLEDQDRLIVNKLAYRLGDPRVGDIVMLYYPEDPSKSFVKRIVAEPGDTIKIVDGRVLRNDVPLADDFIPEKYRDHDNLGPFVLPRGYYYVMGDHRNNSSDSRTWGYVPKRYIIGKVQLRWWPVNSAKVF
jgi:signal peptidase I